METQILIFGIALPVVVGMVFSAWQIFRPKPYDSNIYFGLGISATLFASAMSQDSLANFTTQNRWLWFPLSIILLGALSAISCVLLRCRSATIRNLVVFASVVPAALLLKIPEWEHFTNRFILGVGAAIFAALLTIIVQKRNGFSIPMAFSFALVAPCALAILSGFAKLAVPIAAVSCCLGFLSLVRLLRKSQTQTRDFVGLSGGVVVATIAALGVATGFGYDTKNIPLTAWILAAIAPLGICLGEFAPIRSRPTLLAWSHIIGCIVLAATAILITVVAFNSSERLG